MKVGQRVKLSEAGRQRYVDEYDNPHDLEGTVVPSLHRGWTRVEWDNGYHNSYMPDLKSLQVAVDNVQLGVVKSPANQYTIQGLSFEELQALSTTLAVQSGSHARKTYKLFSIIDDEVMLVDEDYMKGYRYVNVNLDELKEGE